MISLPEKIDSLPVKRAVKVFVFGSNREYEHYCRKQKVRPSGEAEWRKKFLTEFEAKVAAQGAKSIKTVLK